MCEETMKTIRVSIKTHQRLCRLGTVANSMDDVLKMLLDFYDAHKKVGDSL